MNDRSEPPRAAFATVPGTDYGSYHDGPLPGEAPAAGPPVFTTFVPGGDGLCDDLPHPGASPDEPHVSRRQDGWSAANQRAFLEAVSEGHGVDAAARRVGLSASSAYAFRRTAKGAAFALGWRGAALVARDCVAETLLVRALEGTVDTIVRGETVVTRHKYDSRLALALLARLDRQAESAPDPDAKAARLVAQDFDAYLDLVGQDSGAARAGLFLTRRSDVAAGEGPDLAPIYALAAADRFVRTGASIAADVDIADLDPAARAGWTADQWARAEAAGMIAIAAPKADDADETAQASQHSQHSRYPDIQVWQEGEQDEWRTSFPPRDDFDGYEEGEFGDHDYVRELDDFERGCMEDAHAVEVDERRHDEGLERDAFFAEILDTIRDAERAGWLADDADPAGAEQAPQETVESAQQPGPDDDQSDPSTA